MRNPCISRRLPGADASRFRPLVGPEARAVRGPYAEGTAREIHLDRDGGRGVLTLECADRAAVDAAPARLPPVADSPIAFDIHPLGPFTQLAQLFEPQP